ncbi:MAG: PIN domain-containing protein [Planctomycetota bacterium]
MTPLLLDTNVVSYLLKGHPLAAGYRPLLENRTLLICFMTVGELYEGAHRAGWGLERMNGLERTIRSYYMVESSPRVDRLWADVRVARRNQPIDVSDAWIAATALAYGCPLVTHNWRDFAGIPRLEVLTIDQEQGA